MSLRVEGRFVSLDEPSIEHCTTSSTQHSSYHLPSRSALDGVVTRPLTLLSTLPSAPRRVLTLNVNGSVTVIVLYLLLVFISNQMRYKLYQTLNMLIFSIYLKLNDFLVNFYYHGVCLSSSGQANVQI